LGRPTGWPYIQPSRDANQSAERSEEKNPTQAVRVTAFTNLCKSREPRASVKAFALWQPVGHIWLGFHPKSQLVEVFEANVAVVHALDQVVANGAGSRDQVSIFIR